MKKLVLLLAVAFSVSMFSCGGGEAGAACDSDSCAKEATEAPATEPKEEAPATEEAAPATEEAAPAAEEAPAAAEEAPAANA